MCCPSDFFFFSSRRRHTRLQGDWSSDVCSSDLSATVQTDEQGNFELTNVPYNPYHVSVTAPGFAVSQQEVDVRTPVPMDLKISLIIGTATTSVTVEAEANDLLETTPTAHTDVGQQLIQTLP